MQKSRGRQQKLMFYLSILFSDDVRLKSEIKCPEQVLGQKRENVATSELKADERMAEASHPVLTEKMNKHADRASENGLHLALESASLAMRGSGRMRGKKKKSYCSISQRVKVKADTASTASLHTWLHGRRSSLQQSLAAN